VRRSQPTPNPSGGGEVRRQESGRERITKMRVVMTIEDFFYVETAILEENYMGIVNDLPLRVYAPIVNDLPLRVYAPPSNA
ncbi:hypothetical protein, partial [Okeania hirsuta]|uniref:hypothetical protein n=1 Tax=Okeania hirsuta TaxID=1458930 RepID=UPI000FBC7BC6